MVIATPQQWAAVSRRWKQLSQLQSVALFAADELHLMRAEAATMEVVTSRMRYAGSQLEHPRSRSRVCARPWRTRGADGVVIGASSTHDLFNFPPGVRPVPARHPRASVDIVNFEARMQAMARPC